MHLFISAIKRRDDSVNVREKPQHCHDVSPTVEVWRYVTDLGYEEFVHTRV